MAFFWNFQSLIIFVLCTVSLYKNESSLDPQTEAGKVPNTAWTNQTRVYLVPESISAAQPALDIPERFSHAAVCGASGADL